MPEVNSPASASPSTLAGMNPPPSSMNDSDMTSGRIPGSSPDQSGMAGQPNKAGMADAKLSKDVQTLRSAEAMLLEMAQSYPTATKALRSASEALRSAQRQIVSNPGIAEPPVPNTLA